MEMESLKSSEVKTQKEVCLKYLPHQNTNQLDSSDQVCFVIGLTGIPPMEMIFNTSICFTPSYTTDNQLRKIVAAPPLPIFANANGNTTRYNVALLSSTGMA